MTQFIDWLGIAPSKYYDWQRRYGKVNEHNGLVHRDFWLEEWEKQAIITGSSLFQVGKLKLSLPAIR